MATFLDLGLLSHFSVIFPFLLVFIGSYALLLKLEVLSKDKGINAIIAFALASMTLFSRQALSLIFVASPWFVVFFMFLLLFLVVFKFLGVKDDVIEKVMTTEWGAPHWFILIIILLILFGSMGIVFGPGLVPGAGDGTQDLVGPEGLPTGVTEAAPGTSQDFEKNVVDVLFHPKLLGLLSLLLIVVFTMRTIAYAPPKAKKGD
jgi:hypothetical protein